MELHGAHEEQWMGMVEGAGGAQLNQKKSLARHGPPELPHLQSLCLHLLKRVAGALPAPSFAVWPVCLQSCIFYLDCQEWRSLVL